MNWTEIIIRILSKDTDKVTDILQMASHDGIYVEDYSDFEQMLTEADHIELIDEKLLHMDKETAIIHLYINPDENPGERVEYIKERFCAEEIIFEIEIKQVKEENWAENWKKYFKPIEIGDKIVIKPTWENYENRNGRIVLEIDPAMSFGSGQHESTKLCMEFLEKYVDDSTNMLDVGTGSGILAVEALLLGAKSVTAVDIDPMSVRVAMENAELNEVGDKMRVKQSNLTDNIDKKYNLITANIVADVIIKLLEDIHRVLEPGGILIASGIIDLREYDVIEALKNKGLNILEINRDRGWTAICAICVKDESGCLARPCQPCVK